MKIHAVDPQYAGTITVYRDAVIALAAIAKKVGTYVQVSAEDLQGLDINRVVVTKREDGGFTIAYDEGPHA